jgi:hypothetical protein
MIDWLHAPGVHGRRELTGAAGVQGAGADPGVLHVAPHQLLDARPAHALHEAALHLQGERRTILMCHIIVCDHLSHRLMGTRLWPGRHLMDWLDVGTSEPLVVARVVCVCRA